MYKKKAKIERPKHHCPYCGKMTVGAYCQHCQNEGWSEVHKMFGCTNGWDKSGEARARRKKVQANGRLECGVWISDSGEATTSVSWRGRIVVGANAYGGHQS